MKKKQEFILGVMATGRLLDAVLLRAGESGPEILRTFRRHRSTSYATVETADMAVDAADSTSSDFTIQFGDTSSPGELFLSSEFEGVEADPSMAEMGEAASTAVQPAFDMELNDIIAECEAAGYTDLSIAFVDGSTDVLTHEIIVPPVVAKEKSDAKGKKKGKSEAKGRDRTPESERADGDPKEVDTATLLHILANEQTETVDPERVAFLPMTSTEEGIQRQLGIWTKSNDLVIETVEVLRAGKAKMPLVRLLDTEVSLYLGLARAAHLQHLDKHYNDDNSAATALPGTNNRKTLIVRAGVEDTLVMFLHEDMLQHYESLRSITTFDAPETICSRVLLLQDEYGTGDVQQVLILGEEREETLIESFALFFPEASVVSLSSQLPVKFDGDGKAPSRARVLAASVALRLIEDDLYDGVFPEINLLPARLLKRRMRMPVTWHVVAMVVLLFCTSLFFMARYFSLRHEMNVQRLKLRNGANKEMAADAKALQARIDSMQAATAGFVRALDVLDSLLVGSDQWSRALETTSQATSRVSGIWVENWRLEGSKLSVTGNATSRDNVVSLADRLDGSIESLTFSEIRDWPVFSFRMTFPLRHELPEAARYLREHVSVSEPLTPKTIGEANPVAEKSANEKKRGRTTP